MSYFELAHKTYELKKYFYIFGSSPIVSRRLITAELSSVFP